MSALNFALYSAGDGYSTQAKIMGRQSAGKALVNGVARRWPEGDVHAFGTDKASGQALARQLKDDGHTGRIRWRTEPGDAILDRLGAVYYPAPISLDLAHARNTRGPASYSLFGVTHTLSSTRAMDQLSGMVTAPFQPWDALICTSSAALSVTTRLQEEQRAWLAEHLGVTRFVAVQTPVIPLGVNAPAFVRDDDDRGRARKALNLADDEVAFLFAGRLTYHAKANPAPFYQALEAAAARTDRRLVCVEAGVFPNPSSRQAYLAAQKALAPSIRFIAVDGAQDGPYRQAWQAADVFVSLSDNIQETFGLTPVEAMAAGLPVLVSDWNGYKDTVRDGVDGYRIPVVLPPPGAGQDLAVRHATGADSYDFFIGRVSMMTVIDGGVLTERIVALAEDPDLRARLGRAGQARAIAAFDWPVILDRYVDLATRLGEIRAAAGAPAPQPWPARPDPLALFGDYPTQTLDGGWKVVRTADGPALAALFDLSVARYALDTVLLPPETIQSLHRLAGAGEQTVDALLAQDPAPQAVKIRALMWLCKFGVLSLRA